MKTRTEIRLQYHKPGDAKSLQDVEVAPLRELGETKLLRCLHFRLPASRMERVRIFVVRSH